MAAGGVAHNIAARLTSDEAEPPPHCSATAPRASRLGRSMPIAA